jgi:serine/threonine-protein kinase RsbW
MTAPVSVTAPSSYVELDFPARAAFLALARQVVVTAARTVGSFGQDRIDDLELAVSEACTNAIRAHSAVNSEAAIHIRCELGDDRVEVEVTDRGPGFDPARVPKLPPPTDPRRLLHESGLGIPLMKLVADRAEITSSPCGTAVRLVLYALPETV